MNAAKGYLVIMSYKHIRQLRVQFKYPIEEAELPAFRGVIAHVAGQDQTLFHNHLEGGRLRYAYPLIQYKRRNDKPLLVCLEDGVDALPHLFQTGIRTVHLNGRPYTLDVEDVWAEQFTLNCWTDSFPYRIRQWMPFNERNYAVYQEFASIPERKGFLERLLIGNILSFAKGMGWWLDQRIRVHIADGWTERVRPYKGNPMHVMDVDFMTNVSLPPWIGLGKGVSRGYGIVFPATPRNRTLTEISRQPHHHER